MVARDVNGFLLLDKPTGLTSNAALQRSKRLFGARKAGHTGSLDPLATGMLPICFGAATRVAGYVLIADKAYEVTARLGVRTDTDDADGAVVEERPVPELSGEAVAHAIAMCRGPSMQLPPMYSAVKHGGRRLYALARRGVEVERQPRPITVHEIELVALTPAELSLRVVCSKGTYIRTLVTDLAVALGTVGHVTRLRRLWVEPFGRERMWTLEELRDLDAARLDAVLQPIDSVLRDWPKVVLDGDGLRRVCQGQVIQAPTTGRIGLHRLYSDAGELVGLGDIDPAGLLAPRRIFSAENLCARP